MKSHAAKTLTQHAVANSMSVLEGVPLFKTSFFTSLSKRLFPSIFGSAEQGARNEEKQKDQKPQEFNALKVKQPAVLSQKTADVKIEDVSVYKQKQLTTLEESKEYFLKCATFTMDFFVNPIITSCGHYFEGNAINDYFKKLKIKNSNDCNLPCPCCNHDLKAENIYSDPKMKQAAAIVSQANKETSSRLEKLSNMPEAKACIEKYESLLNENVSPFNDDGKRKLRYHWLSIVYQKECIVKCLGLSGNFFNHPVITSCGHYFEGGDLIRYLETLKALSDNRPCPCCAHDLKSEKLFYDADMKSTADKVREESKKMLANIDRVCSKNTDAELTELKQRLIEYEKIMDHEIEPYNQDDKRKLRYQHFYISDKIEALKLNRNNLEHLEYWNKQTQPGWFGYGGDEIKHEGTGRVFRVPRPVYVAIQAIAAKKYDDKELFLREINTALKTKESNPFGFYYRSHSTNLVCDAKNIDEVDLRLNMSS